MGINFHSIAWLKHLAAHGIIRPDQRIIEFGPQSVHGGYESNPAGFYRDVFGIEHYESVDLYDPTATWRGVNLNEPIYLPEKYTLATNFGTFEHVCNIGQAFKVMHKAVEPGGVMLHHLAAYGYIDHGFYSVHPTLYLGLAAANDYVIEDFRYIDAANQRINDAMLTGEVDWDALPISLLQLQTLHQYEIQTIIRNNFLANAKKWGPDDLWDACAVALRKTSDAPFKWAGQTMAGVTILD